MSEVKIIEISTGKIPDINYETEDVVRLNKQLESFKKKEMFNYLINRISTLAELKILNDNSFLNLFYSGSSNAFVISIDIRRSTSLMLKAKSPELYAKFISKVATNLRKVILDNHGVFDKFTGDGILAFFPEFYSGNDAGVLCAKSAIECHKVFEEIYKDSRNCFNTISKDIGLGIGIDYGKISFQKIVKEFVIVGSPVVYACRMSSAKKGQTLLNQSAYEKLYDNHNFKFDETEIEIKHDGVCLAYKLTLLDELIQPQKPIWLQS